MMKSGDLTTSFFKIGNPKAMPTIINTWEYKSHLTENILDTLVRNLNNIHLNLKLLGTSFAFHPRAYSTATMMEKFPSVTDKDYEYFTSHQKFCFWFSNQWER
jgi:hypothetical protein